jgi:hypothetical protein
MQTMTPERPLDLDATVVGPGASPGPVSLRGQVNARLCGAEARESVARSLTRVVEDAFLPGSCSSTHHLRDALDEPIAAATETAITTLVDELATCSICSRRPPQTLGRARGSRPTSATSRPSA